MSNPDPNAVEERMSIILDKLTKIKNKEIYLYNFQYNYFDFHRSEIPQAEIHNKEVVSIIEDTYSLVEDLFKLNLYQQAYDLAFNILTVPFDFPYLPIKKDSFDFCTTEHLYSFCKYAKHTNDEENDVVPQLAYNLTLYGIISAYNLDDRMEKIHKIFQYSPYDFSFNNDILKSSHQELPNFQSFLADWIEFLFTQEKKRLITYLLTDAIFLLDSKEKMDLYLEKCTTDYPQILLNSYDKITASRDKSTFEFLFGTLNKINKKLTCRSDLALKLANDFKSLKLDDKYKKCLLIAFESSANFENYMRYVLNVKDVKDRNSMSELLDNFTIGDMKEYDLYYSLRSWDTNELIELKSKADEFPEEGYEEYFDKFEKPMSINIIGETPVYDNIHGRYLDAINYYSETPFCELMMLRFLDGRFFELIDNFLTDDFLDLESLSLNKSAEFIFSLFILYLYNGKKQTKAFKTIVNQIVGFMYWTQPKNPFAFDFLKPSKNPTTSFYNLIKLWKKGRTVSNADLKKIVSALNGMLVKFYDRLVKSKKQLPYEQLALFIVALGEAQDSLNLDLPHLYEYIDGFVKKYPKKQTLPKKIQSYISTF